MVQETHISVPVTHAAWLSDTLARAGVTVLDTGERVTTEDGVCAEAVLCVAAFRDDPRLMPAHLLLHPDGLAGHGGADGRANRDDGANGDGNGTGRGRGGGGGPGTGAPGGFGDGRDGEASITRVSMPD